MNRFICLIAFVFLFAGCTGFPGPARAAPEKVTVGIYVNDIQEIDLRSHNYRMDFYMWFRWRDPELKPYETAEFMNAFMPVDHVRAELYDAPQKMPDGSLYMVIRNQGQFSVKFPLQRFPFDRQVLRVDIEDSLSPAADLEYVADDTEGPGRAVILNSGITLPGFRIGAPELKVSVYPYPMNFGDISAKAPESYARVTLQVPVTRPWLATGIKIFLPVALIIFCTALVLFVHPSYIEGRLGVVITALLTLVALQLATGGDLPDVDYLLLTHKIYLLSYIFVIATLVQIVRMSDTVQRDQYDIVRAADGRVLKIFCVLLAAGLAIIAATAL